MRLGQRFPAELILRCFDVWLLTTCFTWTREREPCGIEHCLASHPQVKDPVASP